MIKFGAPDHIAEGRPAFDVVVIECHAAAERARHHHLRHTMMSVEEVTEIQGLEDRDDPRPNAIAADLVARKPRTVDEDDLRCALKQECVGASRSRWTCSNNREIVMHS